MLNLCKSRIKHYGLPFASLRWMKMSTLIDEAAFSHAIPLSSTVHSVLKKHSIWEVFQCAVF